MGPVIAQVISLGYTAAQVLNFLSGKYKGVSGGVKSAKSQGYTDEDILKFLGGKIKSKNSDKQLTENDSYLKQQGFKTKEERQESQHKFVKGAFNLGSTALGAYALSRALPKGTQALQGQLLPAFPQQPPIPQLPGGARAALPAPGQPAMQPPYPLPNAPGGSPLPPTNPIAQGMRQPQPMQQQPIATPQTQAQAPTIPQAPSAPPSVTLPPALQKQASAMLDAGNDIQTIAGALQSTQSKIVKDYEKTTGQPIAKAVEDFAQTINQEVEQPQAGSSVSAQEQETPIPVAHSLEQIPEPIKAEAPKKEKGSTVALPNGEIGEITDIRQGIATVESNGKKYTRKVDELEHEPEGLDEVARKMVDLIPEGEKSTAFQESIHLPLPTPEGDGIMVTKYYGGKWAWYLGVSDEDYSRIAEGTFEPKGQARTGIAEYKPGIIDSRGAGNHQLIIQNPKYSKANKGKTWGYANTKYDAFKSINPLLQKMSRERKDEEGNIIEKGEKQTGKGPASVGLPEPQGREVEAKQVENPKEEEKKEEPQVKNVNAQLGRLNKEERQAFHPERKTEKPKPKTIKVKTKPKEKEIEKPVIEVAPKDQKNEESNIRGILQQINSLNSEIKEKKLKGTDKRFNLLEISRLEKELEKERKKIAKMPIKKFGRPEVAPKQLKTQKTFILSKLQEALDHPKDTDYIEIDVPGDGHFRVFNLAESLEKFKERVEKKWPTTQEKYGMKGHGKSPRK